MKGCRFCGQRLTNLDKHSTLRKPPCVLLHTRSKITPLNAWRTDNSLPVSTLVTPESYCDSDNSRVQVRVKVFLWFVRSYRYSIIVSTAKIEYTVHSTIGLLGWNLLKYCFKQLYIGDPGEKIIIKVATTGESNIIFINKADSKVSLKVSVMQCCDKIRSRVWFSISTDETKNLWLSISID